MKAEKISLIIDNVCKNLKIKYNSKNPHYLTMKEDAKRLGEIFRDLKIIAGDLETIADRHQIDGLKEIIHQDALDLETIDHEICRLAQRIRKENVE